MMIGGSSIMTVAHVLPAPAVAPNRSVVAAVIGNAMEWYDFAVYGFFASIIGKLFFPTSEPSLSVIAALGVFAVGFLMRPIGGIVFGYIGDRYGRTFSLFLSIGAMAAGTLAMGLLPTYETAGMLAPILMITCRIVQGLAVGGEYATSIIVLVESAPVRRRGFRGSLACLGATAGNLLGSATGAFLFHNLDENQIAEWGWRIPFLMGVAVAIAGIYLRRKFTAEEHAQVLPNCSEPMAGGAEGGRHQHCRCHRLLHDFRLSRAVYGRVQPSRRGHGTHDQFDEHGRAAVHHSGC